MGPFYIIISTIINPQLSQNYNNSLPYNTNTFTVVKSTPSIIQSSKLVTTGTYGSPYTFYTPSINYNPTIQPAGSISQPLVYAIINASSPGIASIDASGKVTINGAGTFNINAYCNSTSVYNAASLSSPLPIITIDKQTPIIKFSYTLPKPFVTAATYDVSYNLVPATINNDVQTLSYTVVNSVPHNNVVNISTIYDNTNTNTGGANSGTVQYSPAQSNNLQKISYGIIKKPKLTYEGLLNNISFQQLNANILKNYYIVSVQSDTHNVSINSTYSTYITPGGMSSSSYSPNPNYPSFPDFSTAILSTPKDDVYINNISIALAYPASVGITNYFACDLVVKDTIAGLPPVNLTNNAPTSITLPLGVSGGAIYTYNISCNVILTETQLANATLVIKSGSNASYYLSTTTDPTNGTTNSTMYITVNYISILTSKCSIISIPANITTPQNFDLTGFSVMMNPEHSYTISLWLLGHITQNVSGYDIYSGSGTVCATNGSTPYIYGTISQGIPITTVTVANNIPTPFYFNSLGKFYINASCSSTSNYYAKTVTSNKVVIASEIPVITFSKSLINSITYAYNLNYPLPQPIATVNNNIQNISYSIVSAIDDESASTVAKINPEGTQLLINSVGTFKIKASVIETTSLDFSQAEGVSIPIVISPATPQVVFGSTFIKQVTYFKQSINSPNSTYQILGVSTTNTDDPAIALSYSSSDTTVATISGNVVSMVSVGNFYINVSCPPTTNFNGLSGATSAQSPPITIIKATPVITFLPGFSSTWGFNSPTPYSLIGTGITCNNTDTSDIQYTYKILNQIPKNVALSPITSSQIKINNAGSFTLQVQSAETKNYFSSLEHFPVIIPKLTPIIIFPNNFVSPWKYGNNPYTFTAAKISNNYPSQIITYSIIPIYSPNNIPAASFSDPINPASITINSIGTFKIQASCAASANGNYTASNSINPCVSNTISVGGEIPVITFSSSLIGSTNITYAYNLNYTLPYPIATVVNNIIQTQSYFTYSVVEADSDIVSDVASISSNNTSLIVNKVGSFRIYAQVANTINHDYSYNDNYSGIITVNPATPTFPPTLAIPSSWVYDVSYNIPYPTYPAISNTDPNLVFSYSIINKGNSNIASVPVSGTTVKIIGVGQFQISVTISPTTNYTKATQIYPSPSTYYKSIKATPIITFPKNFGTKLIYGNNYNLIPVTVTNNDPLTQPITYSIYPTPTDSNVASIKYIKGNPYVTIISTGKFQISASCPMSTNGYYNAVLQGQPLSLSPPIIISIDIPKVTFNTNNFSSSYVYVYNSPSSLPPYTYPLTAPIASINPSNTNQILKYSIVTYDSTLDPITPSITPSTIATISSDGTSLNTNSFGIFKIYAQAAETPSLDYGPCSSLSNIIKINRATPTITSTLVKTPPPPFIYDVSYNIPYPTTSNTDATSAQIVSYSTDNPGIISISGTVITVTGVGNFQILVTIAKTANYDAVTYTYPSGLVYKNPPALGVTYTSYIAGQATPVITFHQTIIKSAIFGSPFTFTGAIITNNDPSQTITYSIIPISSPNNNIPAASFSDPTNPASITINSIGTFQIQASCGASFPNLYYTAAKQFLPKSTASTPYITVAHEVPKIVFNTNNFNTSYTYSTLPQPTSPPSLPTSSTIASITNNNVQILTYSAVEVDIDTPSPFATISSDGTSLTTTSVGSFRICARAQTASKDSDYGANHEFSNIITINPATPTLPSTLAIPSSWVYSSITPQTYTMPYPTYPATSNTDSNLVFSYSILTPNNTTIATVLGNTITSTVAITSTGVGQFQISVTIAATTNYTQATQIYPSPSTYYTFIATPIIIFPKKFVSSWKYGNNPYTFTAAQISNNDPSQIITYSIIPISSPNNIPAASFSDPTNPASITINSFGTFQIQASCAANGNYTASNSINPCVSNTISVGGEIPIITFSSSLIGSTNITYAYNLNSILPSPIATVVNNTVQTQSYFTYSVVEADSDTVSDVASISSNNTSLIVNKVGSFRIYAQVAHTTNHDYSYNDNYSGIITINPATPTITSMLDISPPLPFIYDVSYNIPYPTTSNTDATSAQIVSYSTDNPDIISISGTVISVTGVGNFQILVTIAKTANYDTVIYTYPSGLVYLPAPGVTYTSYKAGPATPDITFNVDRSATYDSSYNLVPVQFITGDISTVCLCILSNRIYPVS
jgi:hypothetical protein